jgi:prepilin-type processing-associated H-X9-DG protein
VTLTWTPNDALAIAVLRPSQLLQQPNFAALAKPLSASISENLGASMADVEQVTWIMPNGANLAEPRQMVVLQTKTPEACLAIAKAVSPNAVQAEDILGAPFEGSPSYVRPNPRTIIFGAAPDLRLLVAGPRGAPEITKNPAWATAVRGDLATAVDVKAMRQFFEQATREGSPETIAFSAVGPLWKSADVVVQSLSAGKTLDADLTAFCARESDAVRVADTLKAVAVLGRNAAEGSQKDLVDRAFARPQMAVQLMFVRMAEDVLKNTEVDRNGSTVTARIRSNLDAQALAPLVSMIQSSQVAAARARTFNNLRQIALAMHNYHDTYGCLPPAVMLGPDGKTTHSWRVALLPFLEALDVYDKYRFDEPWNSEHNLALADSMPAVYRHPGDNARSTNTSYFVLTGEGGLFGAKPTKKGMSFRDVLDGTSNTVLAVESKQNTPWMKPADIEFDATRGMAQFTPLHKTGVNAAFADGSARLLPANLETKKLNAVFTAAASEIVDIP